MGYEIIATLGPASQTDAVWAQMIEAGATTFRLNTSHLTLEQLQSWLERLENFFAARVARLPVVLDLQGSKWRLGDFEAVELSAGDTVELVLGASSTQAGLLPVPHADFFLAAGGASAEIVLNDAIIHMMIERRQGERIRARVLSGGPLSAHKGITFLAGDFRVEALSEKDRTILAQTAAFPGVRYAISYLKDAQEMQTYRAHCGKGVYLVAKLERGPAMEDAVGIAAIANEVWLCRGDLGAEVGLAEMAAAARRFSTRIAELQVPAIMAGQVLEHMTRQPTATRSEVCYLYDSLQAGYGGFVLSDETAIGSYGVEAVRTAADLEPSPCLIPVEKGEINQGRLTSGTYVPLVSLPFTWFGRKATRTL